MIVINCSTSPTGHHPAYNAMTNRNQNVKSKPFLKQTTFCATADNVNGYFNDCRLKTFITGVGVIKELI